jgi:hypothetical protein
MWFIADLVAGRHCRQGDEPDSRSGKLYPTARCAGGPLPRRAFRSFLATAGDPSPNFGGGVVREVRRAEGVWCERRAPPALPHKLRQTAWGRENGRKRPSAIEFSPFSRAAGKRGRGRGAAFGRGSMLFAALRSIRPIQPPPGFFGGRWASLASPEGACPARRAIRPRTRRCLGRRTRPGRRVRAGGLCEVVAAISIAPAGGRHVTGSESQ